MNAQTMTERSWMSSDSRMEQARIRRDLHSGALTLADVFTDGAPRCLANRPLFELVSWRRGWGKTAMRRIGLLAMRDGVNLAVCAGDASHRSLDWLVALEPTLAVLGPRHRA